MVRSTHISFGSFDGHHCGHQNDVLINGGKNNILETFLIKMHGLVCWACFRVVDDGGAGERGLVSDRPTPGLKTENHWGGFKTGQKLE